MHRIRAQTALRPYLLVDQKVLIVIFHWNNEVLDRPHRLRMEHGVWDGRVGVWNRNMVKHCIGGLARVVGMPRRDQIVPQTAVGETKLPYQKA
jgi:hypothetical protein